MVDDEVVQNQFSVPNRKHSLHLSQMKVTLTRDKDLHVLVG